MRRHKKRNKREKGKRAKKGSTDAESVDRRGGGETRQKRHKGRKTYSPEEHCERSIAQRTFSCKFIRLPDWGFRIGF
jgi:hypothetical protein